MHGVDWVKFRRVARWPVTLTDHQSALLGAFRIKFAYENKVAVEHGEEAMVIDRIQYVPCGVPGMAGVVDSYGFVAKWLPPAPGSFPLDPRYQQPAPIESHGGRRLTLWACSGRFDFIGEKYGAWAEMLSMDAPEIMPAGSVVGFTDENPDSFGGAQSEWRRE